MDSDEQKKLHEEENKESREEIDLTKAFYNIKNFSNLIKKNPYFSGFVILTILFFIISLLGYSNVNLGNNFVNSFIHMFTPEMLLLLCMAFVLSSISAYFRKYKIMFLPIILWILLLSVDIRISNIDGLKDITTNDWTLGPDLDPFLYLRHAQEIDEGRLQNPDTMRNAPLGSDNYALKNLMPWAIFYTYKGISLFNETSITYAAIITPVILFIISAIGFLLFTKVVFSFKFSERKSWIGAIIASLFYITSPSMLHRTTAGIPEIESLGMVWFWFALLFFAMAWKEEKSKKTIIYGVLAGVFTGLMGWSWGGYKYIYMIICLSSLVMFLFQKDIKKNFKIFIWWLVPALIIEFLRVESVREIATSLTDTGLALFILLVMLVDAVIFNTNLMHKIKMEKINLPRSIKSLLIAFIINALFFSAFKPDFIFSIFGDIINKLLHPFGRGRVGLTVAENAVPYFQEILNNFDYLFWTFFFGTLIVFYQATKHFRIKERVTLNLFFMIFITGFIFSRYSPSSVFNGENFISKLLYIGGLLMFIAVVLFIYIRAYLNRHKEGHNLLENFKEIDFSYILLLVFSFWAIVSMRGAIRLLFIISPILPILSSFLLIQIISYRKESNKGGIKRLFSTISMIVLIILMTMVFVNYAQISSASNKATIPSSYNQQWQKAMGWVRDNTLEGSIFVHWWDYGYWVQTIGQRPSVTDGGHFIGYWNHLVGRYVLTTPYPETAFSFMKTHEVSYLLIDPTDIGKYSAYSSIGNDASGNDRYSWIPTVVSDPSQIQETSNGTTRIYQGGFSLDKDIIYEEGGKQILLPEGKAYVAGVILETKNDGESLSFTQPQAAIVYLGNQMKVPVRYLYYDGKILDFKSGINSVVRIVPMIYQSGESYQVDNLGSMMYLSEKTAFGLVGQLYLLNDSFKKYEGINLVHSQQDAAIEYFNSQGANFKDFVYFNGIRGPINIWEVNYPENIIEREEFLRTYGGYGEFDNLGFTK